MAKNDMQMARATAMSNYSNRNLFFFSFLFGCWAWINAGINFLFNRYSITTHATRGNSVVKQSSTYVSKCENSKHVEQIAAKHHRLESNENVISLYLFDRHYKWPWIRTWWGGHCLHWHRKCMYWLELVAHFSTQVRFYISFTFCRSSMSRHGVML